jgi:hypothetical protein
LYRINPGFACRRLAHLLLSTSTTSDTYLMGTNAKDSGASNRNAMSHSAPSNTAPRSTAHTSPMMPPLVPLEYLQNHRRGSITDPYLHAAASSSSLRSSPVTSPTLPSSMTRPATSSFVFGNATPREREPPSISRAHHPVKIEETDDVFSRKAHPVSPQSACLVPSRKMRELSNNRA